MPTPKVLHPHTIQHYMRRYRALNEDVQRELSVEEATPEELIAFLLKMLEDGGWTQENWRLIKASVVYCLELFHGGRTDLIERLRTIKYRSPQSDQVTAKVTSKPTPTLSPLGFQKAWGVLERALVERHSMDYKNALPLLAVLRATLLGGLRTREWCLSKIEFSDTHPMATLIIEDRLSPEFALKGLRRELILDRLPPSDFRTIEAAIQAVNENSPHAADKVVKRLQKEFAETITSLNASKEVSRGIKKILAELSILSFRQQFALRAQHTYSGHPLGPWILAELLDSHPYANAPSLTSYPKDMPSVLVLPSPASMKSRLDRMSLEYQTFFADTLKAAGMDHQ